MRSPPFPKPFSIIGDSQFNDANTSLNNFLKTLSKSGQIAQTVYKEPLTKEIVAKLYEEGANSLVFISLFLGKRGCEDQQLSKKHMLITRETSSGEKYLEMSREREQCWRPKTIKVASTTKKASQTAKYSKGLAQNAVRNTCHILIQSAAVYSRNHEAHANRLTQQEMLCGTA